MLGNRLLPAHGGLLITRGLQELACPLPQELPFATAARLLGWQVGEPQLLGATTLRTLVRTHGDRVRDLECTEAVHVLSYPGGGKQLGGVPLERPRRHPGWPAELSAAVEAALADDDRQPPAGMTRADWEQVRGARPGAHHSPGQLTPARAARGAGPVRADPGRGAHPRSRA
jgi:hypothetical protein